MVAAAAITTASGAVRHVPLVSALDWTVVTASCISAFGAIVAAFVGAYVARQVRTPSGDRLGEVAERTEHLASASVMQTSKLLRDLDGGQDDTGEGAA